MRAGHTRPGLSADFIDTSTEEVLLRVACSADGQALIAYHLYDARGQLVAETEDFTRFPGGVRVVAPDGDVLLNVPPPPEEQLSYRLYNRQGRLLTCSDGQRTQIYSFLRMERGKVT